MSFLKRYKIDWLRVGIFLKIKVLLFSFIIVNASFLLSACSDVRFNLLDAQAKTLSDFQGKWLFINYWAEWCKPCLKEIPELNKFSEEKNVVVIGFNYDHLDEEKLREQIRAFGIKYPSLLIDPSLELKQSPPTGLPATMVINPKGEFVKWLYGAQTNEALKAIVD